MDPFAKVITADEDSNFIEFANLPKGIVKNGTYYKYFYRVKEIKVGNVEVWFVEENEGKRGVEYEDTEHQNPALHYVPVESNDGKPVTTSDGNQTYTITNKPKDGVTSLKVSKAWSDAENAFETRGSSWQVFFGIYRSYKESNGSDKEEIVYAQTTGKQYGFSLSDSLLSKTIDNLPKYKFVKEADGGYEALEYTYYVKEFTADPKYDGILIEDGAETVNKSYTVSYGDMSTSMGEDDSKAYTQTVTNNLKTISLTVTKNWAEDKIGNASPFRPEKLEWGTDLFLYRATKSGEEYSEKTDITTQLLKAKESRAVKITWDTSTKENVWTYTIDGLPECDSNGNSYYYFVKESTQAGYLEAVVTDPQISDVGADACGETEAEETEAAESDVEAVNTDETDDDTGTGKKDETISLTNTATKFTLEKLDEKGEPLPLTDGSDKVEITLTGKSAVIDGKTVDTSAYKAVWTRTKDEETVTVSKKVANEEYQEQYQERYIYTATVAEGSVEIKGLPLGTYDIEENVPPYGYKALASGATLTLSSGKDTERNAVTNVTVNAGTNQAKVEVDKTDKTKVKITDTPTDITIVKVDATNATEYLSGAEFELKPAEGSRFAKTTGDKAVITIARNKDENDADTSAGVTAAKGELIAGNTYILTETKSPNGYIRTDSNETDLSIAFTVADDGRSITLVDSEETSRLECDVEDNELKLKVKNDPVKITLTKKQTGKDTVLLQGAKFTLEDKTDNSDLGKLDDDRTPKKDDLTTNQKGELELTGVLSVGHTYELTETDAPAGYILPDNPLKVQFTVKPDGTIGYSDEEAEEFKLGTDKMSFTLENDPLKMYLYKTDVDDSKKSLSGAVFSLYWCDENDGETVKTLLAKGLTTGEDGTLTIEHASTETNLDDSNPKAVLSLKAGEKYVLKETTAPAGYELMKPFYFQFKKNGELEEVGFETDPDDDIPGSGKVELKQDGTDAKTTIIASDKKTEFKLEKYGLDPAYSLDNTNPKIIDDGVELTVYTTTSGAKGDVAFVWEKKTSEEVQYIIDKTESVFKDTDLSCNKTTGVITGLPAGTYYVEETETPENYLQIVPFTFTLDEYGELTAAQNTAGSVGTYTTVEGLNTVEYPLLKVTDTRVRGHVELTKTLAQDNEEGEEKDPVTLPDVQFSLYRKGETDDSEDTLIAENITTGADGTWTSAGNEEKFEENNNQVAFKYGLLPGDYYFKETRATADSQINSNNIAFTIDKTGAAILEGKNNGQQNKTKHVSVENEPFQANLSLTKYDKTSGEAISGNVKFNLKKISDNILDAGGNVKTQYPHGATDTPYETKDGDTVVGYTDEINDSGMLTFEGLTMGTYELTEVSAVGYAADPNFKLTIVVDTKDAERTIPVSKAELRTEGNPMGSIIKAEGVTWAEDEAWAGTNQTGASKTGITNERVPVTVALSKTDAADNNQKLNGVIFKLQKRVNTATGAEEWEDCLTNLETGKTYRFADKSGQTDKDAGEAVSTNNDGILSLTGVEWGTYRLVETAALDGYVLPANAPPCEFTVDRDSFQNSTTNNVTLQGALTNSQTKLQILKQNEIGESLAGAEFTVSGKFGGVFAEKPTLTVTTNKQGLAVFGNDTTLSGALIAEEEYTLKETKAPDGYKLLEGEFKLKIKTDGTAEATTQNTGYRVENEAGVIKVTAVDKPIDIKIRKTGPDDETVTLSGAEFKLEKYAAKLGQDPSYEEIPDAVVELDAPYSGTYAVHRLVVGGRYRLTETEPPKGYEVPHTNDTDGMPQALSVEFTVNNDGTISYVDGEEAADRSVFAIDGNSTGITVKDQPISISLEKQSMETLEVLSGAEFSVTGHFGNSTAREIISGVTAENIGEKLNGKLIAGNVYDVTETKAPDGYQLASFSFRVDEYGNISMSNREPLSGAIAEDEQFGYAQGDASKLIVRDKSITLNLIKGDSAGNPLAEQVLGYALFAIAPAKGNAFADGSTEEITFRTSDLLPSKTNTALLGKLKQGNTYILREVHAPNSSFTEVKSTCTIHVDNDGKITAKAEDTENWKIDQDGVEIQITLINKGFKVTLQKVNENGKPLADASFELTGTFKGSSRAEKRTFELKSDQYGQLLIYEKDSDDLVSLEGLWLYSYENHNYVYTLEETAAPEGYRRWSDKVHFIINKDGQITLTDINGTLLEEYQKSEYAEVSGNALTLTLKNKPIELKIQKRMAGQISAGNLAGAKFDLYDVTGTGEPILVYQWTSKAEAEEIGGHLTGGHRYLLKETSAPQGADYSNERYKYTFKVDEDGTVTITSQGSSASGLPFAELDAEKTTMTVRNVPVTLSIWKKSSATEGKENDALLSGAKYEITGTFAEDLYGNSKGKLAEAGDHTLILETDVTNNTDNVLKGRLLYGETYYIQEVAAPKGQSVNNEKVAFTLTAPEEAGVRPTLTLSQNSGNGGYTIETDENGNPVILQRDDPTQIALKKIGENDDALSGAEFELKPYDVSNSFANSTKSSIKIVFGEQTSVTAAVGELVVGNIYILTETKAPEGYVLPKKEEDRLTIIFKVNEDGTVTTEAAGSDPQLGVKYNGKADVSHVKITKAEDGKGSLITVSNDPVKITVVKKDGNSLLSGARFKLEEKAAGSNDFAELEGVYTTDARGSVILAGSDGKTPVLKQGNTYRLKEVEAPAGYELPHTVQADGTIADAVLEFTVNEDGTVIFTASDVFAAAGVTAGEVTTDTIIVNDTKTAFKLEKREENKNVRLEKDITLTVKDADSGEVVFVWKYASLTKTYSVEGAYAGQAPEGITCDPRSGLISGLPEGTYTVEEATPKGENTAPGGYRQIQPFSFTLDEYGRLTVADTDSAGSIEESAGDPMLIVSDKLIRGHVTLTKYLGTKDEGRTLQSVKFALYRVNGKNDMADSTDDQEDTLLSDNLVTGAYGTWSTRSSIQNYDDGSGVPNKPFSDGLRSGTYYFVEIQATAGTALNKTKYYEFTITDRQSCDAAEYTTAVIAENERFSADLKLTKYDGTSGDPINGNVIFNLKKTNHAADGVAYPGDDITTGYEGNGKAGTVGSDGTLTFTGLTKGTYELTETYAKGYEVDENKKPVITIVVGEDDNGKIIEVKKDDRHITREENVTWYEADGKSGIANERRLGTVTLHKVDGAATSIALNGVEFGLEKPDGKGGWTPVVRGLYTGKAYVLSVDEMTGAVTAEETGNGTVADGVLTVAAIPWGEYRMTELTPAEGYGTSDGKVEAVSEAFAISRDNAESVLELKQEDHAFYNYKTVLQIVKTDLTGAGGEAMKNAVFTISGKFAGSRETSIEKTTDENGKLDLRGVLVAGEIYTLTEKTAPAGYEPISGAISFTMEKSGKISVLSGAAVGQKPGYALTVSQFTDNVITASDEPIYITIKKTDADGKTLTGAKLTLTDLGTDGTGTETVTFTCENRAYSFFADEADPGKSIALTQGHTYRLTEIAAPAGYVLPKDSEAAVTFTVNADGTAVFAASDVFTGADGKTTGEVSSDTLIVRDIRTAFKIEKYGSDPATGQISVIGKDVTLTVSDENNVIVFVWHYAARTHTYEVKDAYGKELKNIKCDEKTGVITGLPAGTYTVNETTADGENSAPSGYLQIQPFSFTINEHGELTVASGSDGSADSVTAGGVEYPLLKVSDEKIRGHVKLTKYLDEVKSGSELAGVTFALYLVKGSVDERSGEGEDPDELLADGLTTNADGVWTSIGDEQFGSGLTSGTYYFVETAAADESVLDSAVKHVFTINGKATVQPTPENTKGLDLKVTNVPFAASLKLTKYDEVTNKPISGGVVFTLTKIKHADGSEVAQADRIVVEETIRANGTLTFEGLTKGTYELKEISAAGYNMDSAFAATISVKESDNGREFAVRSGESGINKTAGAWNAGGITNGQAPANNLVVLEKTDADGSPLENVEFKLQKKNENDEFADVPGQTGLKTDSNGKLTLSDLAWGEYRVVETKPADGYHLTGTGQKPVSCEFTVDREVVIKGTLKPDGTVDRVTNGKTKLTLRKRSTNGEALTGAQFNLKPASEKDSFVTKANNETGITVAADNAEGVILAEGELIAGNTYVLRETKAPDGYRLIEKDIIFTVSAYGRITAGSGAVSAGAEGYALEVSAEPENVITATDAPITVSFSKTNESGKVLLAGAQFMLEDLGTEGTAPVQTVKRFTLPQAGKAYSTITDETEGTAAEITFTQGHIYRLTEIKAPAGYEPPHNADGTKLTLVFTVKADGTVEFAEGTAAAYAGNGTAAVTVKDEKTSFTLKKLNSETGSEIKDDGLELTVSAKGGADVFTWTHDNSGYGITNLNRAVYTELDINAATGEISGLPAGTYTMRETKTPYGYLTIRDVEFTIDENGDLTGLTGADGAIAEATNTLNITDTVIRGHVELTKYLGSAANGNELAGVTFSLYRVNGEVDKVPGEKTETDASDTLMAERLTTGTDGVWRSAESTELAKGLTSGEYYFVETDATADSVLNDTAKYRFSIAGEGTEQPKTVTVTAVNDEFAAELKLTKYDAADGTPIDGDVTFVLRRLSDDADGRTYPHGVASTEYDAVAGVSQTVQNGTVTFAGLTKGTYELTETYAKGYEIDREKLLTAVITVGEGDNGRTLEVKKGDSHVISLTNGEWLKDGIANTRVPGKVTLYKADGESGEALNDVEFGLQKSDGNGGWTTVAEGLKTGHTYVLEKENGVLVPKEDTGAENEDGRLAVDGIAWGTYRMIELTPANGYGTSDGADNAAVTSAGFAITRYNAEDGIELAYSDEQKAFYNYKTVLGIVKKGTDGAAGAAMAGAEFTLSGAKFAGEGKEKTAITVTTDSEGRLNLKGILVVGVEYTLTETKAPAGYQLIDGEVRFTMDKSGEIRSISGTAAEKKPGYELTEHQFVNNLVTASDGSIAITLKKTGADGKELTGAKFTLTDLGTDGTGTQTVTFNCGNRPYTAFTDENGSITLTQGHTYRLTEIAAPAGYELPHGADGAKLTLVFTVNADGTVKFADGTAAAFSGDGTAAVTVKDEKTSFILKKLNNETGKEIKDDGLELTVSIKGGADVFTWTHDNDGYGITNLNRAVYTELDIDAATGEIRGLPAGTYTVRETKTPYGYLTIRDVEFTIDENGDLTGLTGADGEIAEATNTLNITDTVIRGHVSLTKTLADAGEKNRLQNVTFDLYRVNGIVDEEPGTAENGDIADVRIAENLQTNQDGVWTTVGNEAFFKDVPAEGEKAFKDGLRSGTYYFVERLATADSVLDKTPIAFVIEGNGADEQPHPAKDPVIVANEAGKDTNVVENAKFSAAVKLTKYNAESGEPVAGGVTFRLEKTGNEADGAEYPQGVTATEYEQPGGVTAVIGEDGTLIFEGLTKGTYHLTEISAWGYGKEEFFEADIVIGEDDHNTVVEVRDGVKNVVKTVGSWWKEFGIANRRETAELTVIKTDAENAGELLRDVEFKLQKKDAQGEYQDILTGLNTGKIYRFADKSGQRDMQAEAIGETRRGELVVKDIAWGDYRLVETKPHDGYSTAARGTEEGDDEETVTAEFIVDRESFRKDTNEVLLKDIVLVNHKTVLTIRKQGTDGVSGEAMKNAQFTISGERFAGAYAGETSITVATGEDGKLTLKGVLIAGVTYTLTETKAPAGYERIDGTFTFTVDTNGKVLAEDGTKNDAESGENDTAGSIGEGYELTAASFFDNVITVSDTPIDVKLVKTDRKGEKLTGAEFTLTGEFADGSGEILLTDENFETALKAKFIASTDEKEYVYTLRETKAPAGYRLMEDVLFTVNEGGLIVLKADADGRLPENVKVSAKDGLTVLTAENEPVSVKFLKRLTGDTVTSGIAGAKFILKAEEGKTLANGEIAFEWTSEAEIVEISALLIGGDTYTLTEIIAPEGALAVNEETQSKFVYTFTVDEAGAVTNVQTAESSAGQGLTYQKDTGILTIWNEPAALIICKKGTDTGTLQKDAVFEITGRFAGDRYAKAEGPEASAGIHTLTVRTNGSDSMENALKGRLIVGETYTVTEVAAPNGYTGNSEEIRFTVTGTALVNGKMQLLVELAEPAKSYEILTDADGAPTLMQRDFPIEVNLRKVDAQGNPLAGAVFEITGIFGDDGQESTKTFVSTWKGTVDLSKIVNEYNLKAGHRYVYAITETKAPAGYRALEGTVYFRVIRTEEGRAQVQVLSQTPVSIRGKLALNADEDNENLSILDIVNEKIPGTDTPDIPGTPERPDTPGKPGSSGGGSRGHSGGSSGTSGRSVVPAKTGDNTDCMFYLWLMLLAAAAVGGTATAGKKRRKKW